MKKGDYTCGLLVAMVLFILIYPQTNFYYKVINGAHPYLVGFLKFAVLATMGEMLSNRLIRSDWKRPSGIYYRALIWGFLGMVIVLIFEIFAKGVTAAQAGGLLPFKGVPIAFAFFTSVLMNLTFAPTMMAFHRITDAFLDLYYELKKFPTMNDVINKINWNSFVSFVVLKTIPAFWIPAHTITFLLPSEYRVIVAALLSIALGGILAFAANTKKENAADMKLHK